MKTFFCSVAQKGFYAGKIRFIHPVVVQEQRTEDPAGELKRLKAAAATLEMSLEKRRSTGENAKLLETVREILSDEAFLGRVEQNIKVQLFDAPTAVRRAGKELAEELGKVDSEYIRSRRDDVRGVADKLISILGGESEEAKDFSAICAGEISPALLSAIPEDLIGGLLTEKGSPNSHVSILAGNLGIPYLYGNSEAVEAAEKAEYIILDSGSGKVIIDPDEKTRKSAEERMERQRKGLREQERVEVEDTVECRTRIYANIEGPQDLEALLASGADGVGLFRTEFLFMGRETLPTEEEQYEVYRKVLKAMGDKEVIIRSMDVGSDKKVPCLKFPKESNPALGMRGIRVSLERPALFDTQLRALLRAGTVGNLKVMFPMIASSWEVDEIKKQVQAVAAGLKKEGIPYRIPKLGIMVETPAAALCAEELAEKVSFFSIGTNDLTQYTLALDREARGMERYFAPHHEAVFKLIRMTAAGGHKHNVPTGVCGQLAGDPEAVGRLIEAGVDELSVAVRKVKATRRLAAEAEKMLAGKSPLQVAAVADGDLIPMQEIPDRVFSNGTMGECFGILPEDGKVYAPISGTVSDIAQTAHAITISGENGRQVLVHVGIDTVRLGGKAFKLYVKTGDRVEADQLLLEADLDLIREAGLSPMIIVAALNG